MFVRATTVTRSGKSYQYAQLVESFRGDDGVPRHRVVANLGRVTNQAALENLRAAFGAYNAGDAVVLDSSTPAASRRPNANLRYLDVAVVREMLERWDVPALLQQCLAGTDVEVPVHKVVEALVVQRCVAPNSKLHAVRWFPRTALPELLAIDPTQFNNTRVHRTLEALQEATPDLMRGLSERCARATGGFAHMFLDATDTWFVGEGPALAHEAKTKEGFFKRKIGIVLLASPEGYPLRWHVMHGKQGEQGAMLAMMNEVATLPWLQNAPIVCDRAMGTSQRIGEMLETSLPFLTAVVSHEHETYAPSLAQLAASLSSLRVDSEEQLEQAAKQAAHLVEQAGMQFVDDTLLINDLGKVTMPDARGKTCACTNDRPDQRVRDALRHVLAIEHSVNDGTHRFLAHAARARGLSAQQAKDYRKALRLPEDICQRILAGEAEGRSVAQMRKIARLPNAELQRQAFDALCSSPCASTIPSRRSQEASSPEPCEPKQLRCCIYFNPELFARQRMLAQRTVRSIETYVDELNVTLLRAGSATTQAAIRSKIEQKLRKRELLKAFNVRVDTVEQAGRRHSQARVELIEQEWQRRRRSDGFSVLVAHESVSQSALELCRVYRAKDAVERGFRTIKSTVELRPVRHRTDLKVRAHVTLCMLALLVHRTLATELNDRLKQDVHPELALESLESCHLNYFAGARPVYSLTQPDDEQKRLLRALRLRRLIDQEDVRSHLTPRGQVVSTQNTNS